MEMYEGLDLLEWAQIVALGGAAVFFVAKVVAGFFVVDMSLEPSAERTRVGDTDVVALSVVLRKGGTGSILLDDTAVRASFGGTPKTPKPLLGVRRLALNRDHHNMSAPWSDGGRYRLPRGESTAFACFFEQVPRQSPCAIEVVIVGRQWWSPWRGQWRTSLISLPKADGDKATEGS